MLIAIRRIAGSMFILLLPSIGFTAGDLHPVAVPDTSSPRATLLSCQDFVRRYADLMRQRFVLKEQVSQRSIDKLEGKLARCFDFSDIPRERIDDVGSETAIYLQETLDRTERPQVEEIPDAATAKSEELTRWRVPGTDIDIVRSTEGPTEGEWLFSARAVSSLKDQFHEVEALPYRPDAVVGVVGPLGGLYDYGVIYPEASIPHGWIDALPAWTMAVYFEQPVWKWLAMSATLIAGAVLFVLILRASLRGGERRDRNRGGLHWWKILPAASGVVIALTADHIIDEIIGTTGKVDLVAETALWMVVLICSAWTIVALINLLAQTLIRSPRIDPEGVNASLISITGHVIGFAAALWFLVEGAENLGLSLIPVIAGLGVGGLAIALAVRPTLENLIGGFILFIDKPVGIGDRCRFGDQLGDIEKIGLRSTRIRSRENTLLTIPNAEFSNMQIENLTKRKYTLYRVTLALRYETTPDQLRYVMAQAREMLLGHPKVTSRDLRVRFRDLGEYSLDVEVFAYTRTKVFDEYWAIREDLNLRIMDIVKDAGTGFAFPSATEYFAPDSGLDAERGAAAEERVREWRSKGRLPFPEFDEAEYQRLNDTLDYPPSGSPHHRPHSDFVETETPASEKLGSE